MVPTPDLILASFPKATNSERNSNGCINESFESDREEPKQNDVLSKVKHSVLNSSCEAPNLDFDDVLPYLGEFGRYQQILFILMIPFAFYVAFVYFTQIFITLVPDKYWCRIPELEHLNRTGRFVRVVLPHRTHTL